MEPRVEVAGSLPSSGLLVPQIPKSDSTIPWLISVSSEETCTLAIIKPDAVVHGKTDEIIMKVKKHSLCMTVSLPLCGISSDGAAGSGVLMGKGGFYRVETQIPFK